RIGVIARSHHPGRRQKRPKKIYTARPSRLTIAKKLIRAVGAGVTGGGLSAVTRIGLAQDGLSWRKVEPAGLPESVCVSRCDQENGVSCDRAHAAYGRCRPAREVRAAGASACDPRRTRHWWRALAHPA